MCLFVEQRANTILDSRGEKWAHWSIQGLWMKKQIQVGARPDPNACGASPDLNEHQDHKPQAARLLFFLEGLYGLQDLKKATLFLATSHMLYD